MEVEFEVEFGSGFGKMFESWPLILTFRIFIFGHYRNLVIIEIFIFGHYENLVLGPHLKWPLGSIYTMVGNSTTFRM